MIIFPSIDIRDGRCVRLVEGDFRRETVFDDDPRRVARRFAADGAEWIHVVDLDGSVQKQPVSLELVADICRELAPTVRIQLGGGLRALDHIERAFGAGVERVVLGSVAVERPALVADAARTWPRRVAVGIDARNGYVATNGWLDQSSVAATDLARAMIDAGITTFIFTDIARDGTLSGPNLAALRVMVTAVAGAPHPVEVIASGGVGTERDLDDIAGTGAAGAIIGRAIYDHRIDLPAVLARFGGTPAVQGDVQ